MAKPTFSLPVIMDARTTKRLLDDEVNRYGGLIWDGTIVAASDPTLAQQVRDDVAASASAAQQSADDAALYDGPRYPDVTAFFAAPDSFTAGTYVRTDAEGLAYRAVDTGGDVQNSASPTPQKFERLGLLQTPSSAGKTDGGVAGVSDNLTLGGFGTWDDGDAAGVPTRPAWDPIDGPNPTASGNDLEMAGHIIDSGVNSAVILGGRPGYYSWVGDDASLSCTYGGDNINTHIAGMNFGMHSDLVQGLSLDGVTEKGDHGAIFGGSYHRVSGSYSISAGGQVKDVFGLQCGAFAGLNIRIGSLANVDAVRRSVTAGGFRNEITAGFQSAIIGGESNTWTAGDNGAIIGGDNNEVDNTEHGFVASSQFSKVTANRGSVISSTFAVADVPNAITRSVGRDTVAGDSQTHHIEVRRTSIGPNLYPSVTGASGVELFTPQANTVGVVRLLLSVQEKQTLIDKGAAYEIRFRYSNIGGTLSIKGQNLIVIDEDDAAWDCSAVLTGGSTRLAVVIQTNGDTGTYLVTGTGEIVVQKVQ